jgi:hypothetical protein
MAFRLSFVRDGIPSKWKGDDTFEFDLIRTTSSGIVLVTPWSFLSRAKEPTVDLESTSETTTALLRVFFTGLRKTVYAGIVYDAADGIELSAPTSTFVEARVIHPPPSMFSFVRPCRVFCPGSDAIVGPCVDCQDGEGVVRICC